MKVKWRVFGLLCVCLVFSSQMPITVFSCLTCLQGLGGIMYYTEICKPEEMNIKQIKTGRSCFWDDVIYTKQVLVICLGLIVGL